MSALPRPTRALQTAAQRVAAANLARHLPAAANDEALLNQYTAALHAMDWQFEGADDGSAYRRGCEALAKLHTLQAQVDPNGSVWLLHLQRIGNPFGAPGPRTGCFA